MNFHEKMIVWENFISEAPKLDLKSVTKLKKELADWMDMEKMINKEVIKRSMDPLKKKDTHDSLKGQMYKVREYINGLKSQIAAATS